VRIGVTKDDLLLPSSVISESNPTLKFSLFLFQLDNYATICFVGLIMTFLACSICELRWSKVTFEAWWRNEQFWVIAGTSAHLAAVLQVRGRKHKI
jgi:hypothetical protein